jgi:hypothetical protein
MTAGSSRTSTRRVVASCLALALASAAVYSVRLLTSGGRSAYVYVRWAENLDADERATREAAYGLIRGEIRDGRTWGYYLTDGSRANVQALVQDGAVDDTHQIDRQTFAVQSPPDGPYARGPAWVARTLDVVALLLAALAAAALATAAAGSVSLPAFLRVPQAAASVLFAEPGRALSATVHWIGSLPSAESAVRYATVMVFLTACVLRVALALVNQEANDDHMTIVRAIAFEGRVPGLADDWQGFQPKLFHWTIALLLWWLEPTGALAQIRLANLVNCAAGIATLLILRHGLTRSGFSPSTTLLTFSLIALNPALVGINSQATNDSFVIVFATTSLYFGAEFFRSLSWGTSWGSSWTRLLGMTAAAILAGVSKGTGLVVVIVYLCVFAVLLIRRAGSSPPPRGRVLAAMALCVALFVPAVAFFGPYLDNYRTGGSIFAQNITPAPLPHFWKETDAYRPGIRSIVGGFLTFRFVNMLEQPALMNSALHDRNDPTNYHVTGYPLHQTSLWSQLYGNLHFVHFANWPETWRTRSEIVRGIGRAALILGLAPTAVLLLGMLGEGARCLTTLVGRRGPPRTAGELVFPIAALGSLAFSIAIALRMRDFGIMKVIYIFPGLLAFGWCFARGYETLLAHSPRASSTLPALFRAVVGALCVAYVLDSVTLIDGLLEHLRDA